MEVPQGNSLCSYLKQPKMSLFFFFFFFSYIKSENRRVKQVLPGVLVPVGGGDEEIKKEGEYGANTVYTSV
jgi:hypothetical protein